MQIPELGTILFLAISGLIVLSSLVVVTSPNLVHSAVSLLFTLFSVTVTKLKWRLLWLVF